METMPVGTTEWDVEDYLESIRARLSPLKRVGDDLVKSATHVHKALWPEDPSPRNFKVLAERLSEGRNRLRAWRKSAARAGAEEALMWVLSWFEDLDLEKLAALREGSPWIDDPELVKKRQAIAYEMAQYAPAHVWIPNPNPQAEDESEDEDAEGEDAEGEEGEDEGEDADAGEESEGDSDDVEENFDADSPPRPPPTSDAPSSSRTAGQ